MSNIVTSLDNLIQKEKELVAQQSFEKMGDVWAEYSQQVKDSTNSQTKAIGGIKDLSSAYGRLQDIFSGKATDFTGIEHNTETNMVGALLDEAGIGATNSKYLKNDGRSYDFSEITEEDKKAIEQAYNSLLNELTSQQNQAETTISNQISNFKSSLASALYDDSSYKYLESDEQSFVDILIQNLDSNEELADKMANAENWDEAYGYFQDEILNKIASLNLSDNSDKKKQFDDAWSNLLAIDTDKPLAENIDKIDDYVGQLADALDMDADELSISLGYDVEGDKEKLETAKSRFTQYLSDDEKSALDDYFNTLSEKEIDILLLV